MNKTKMNDNDLTKGGILNKLLLISVPIMGTQLLQMTYNLTDMFWLGRVSSDAVAASGTAGIFTWLSMAFLMIGRMGAEIGVPQCMGRRDENGARRFGQNALFLAIVLGVLFGGVLIVFKAPFIGFFKIQEAHVAGMAENYLAIIGVGIPLTFMSGCMNGIFNGTGNSRLPFLINGIGLLLNMILDPLLILKFNLGIEGAAIATVAAQALVCLLFFAAIKFYRSRPFESFLYMDIFRPDKKLIRQIVKWSLPVSLESFFFTCLSMFISRMVAAYGADAIAVQRVGSQVESLTWLLGGGFSSALTAFIGQNYGAGKWTRIHKGFHIAAAIMCAWGVIVTILLYTCGRMLFGIFLPNPALMDAGEVYLRILSVCQLAMCLESLAAGAFRGIGRTAPTSVISITCNLLRVPIAHLLAATALGINGIWWGLVIGASLRGIIMLLWYLVIAKKQPRMDVSPAR